MAKTKPTYQDLEKRIIKLESEVSKNAKSQKYNTKKIAEKALIQAKEKAEENEKLYHALVENISGSFAYYKVIFENGKPIDFEFIEVNKNFGEQTGLRDVVGKRESEIVPGIQESDPELFEIIGRIASTGKSERLEYYVKAMDKWFSSLLYSPEKGYCVSINQEITEQKKSEKALDESDRQYNLLFDSMEEMVSTIELIYDKDGQPIDWYLRELNPSFAKFLGKTRDQLLNKRITSIIDTIEDYWLKSFASVDKTGEATSFQNYGVEFNKYYNVVAWKISKNRVGVSLIDITEIKHTEIELKKAKQQAEESDKLKSAFLANMSHEIRTPMNAILGFSNLLKEKELSYEKKVKYIDLIDSAGKRLLTLILDIVDISKIDANQLSIHLHVFNLNKLINTLYSQFSTKFTNTEVTLIKSCALTNKASFIKSDEVRLMQILSNLIENALKFTKKGQIEFGYSVEDKLLRFFVKDTGIGIGSKNHESIFERFRQVNNNYRKSAAGTGLGLPIVKGLVHLLDGKIWVESELNKGATFYFSIPYIRAEKTIDPEKLDDEFTYDSPNKTTILVAEDEHSNFLYIKELLEDYSYNIIHAKNGQEVVDIVSNNTSISLILMDIKMPVMDGLEATKEIRKTNKHIPIIALTAYAMPEDQQKTLDVGCNDYMAKPFSTKLLTEMMKKYLT